MKISDLRIGTKLRLSRNMVNQTVDIIKNYKRSFFLARKLRLFIVCFK